MNKYPAWAKVGLTAHAATAGAVSSRRQSLSLLFNTQCQASQQHAAAIQSNVFKCAAGPAVRQLHQLASQ